MRKIATLIMLLAFAINSIAGGVGTLVLCAHSDHLHLEFSKQHACAVTHEHANDEHSNLFSPDFEKCSDFVLESSAAQNRAASDLRAPLPACKELTVIQIALLEPELKTSFCKIAPQNPRPPDRRADVNAPLII